MLKDKKVVITGGCGFIGSHLAETFMKDNRVVIIDDLSAGKLENIRNIMSSVELVNGSILEHDVVTRALENADYVFHTAAIASVFRSLEDPILTNNINIEGTVRLLGALRDSDVKRFVFISSAAVYGAGPTLPKKEDMSPEATSPYGVSKIIGEHQCRVHSEIFGLETVSARLFNVYGPRQNPEAEYATVIPKFIGLMLRDEAPQIYGDGMQTRDFAYIDDVVEGLILAGAKGNGKGEVYNIATGRETSVNGLVETLNGILGKNIKAQHVDPVPGDIRLSVADISKAKKELGYAPKIDLREGLRRTIEFYS